MDSPSRTPLSRETSTLGCPSYSYSSRGSQSVTVRTEAYPDTETTIIIILLAMAINKTVHTHWCKYKICYSETTIWWWQKLGRE
jgi:hypothetical protein